MTDAERDLETLPPVPDSWWNGGMQAAMEKMQCEAAALDSAICRSIKEDAEQKEEAE